MNARIAERDQPEPTPEDSRYLRMGEVMRLTGMTHAMIYDGVRAKTFPKWADLPKRGSGWLKTRYRGVASGARQLTDYLRDNEDDRQCAPPWQTIGSPSTLRSKRLAMCSG
jgi:predicted DNA-binding transcriptional regulator AlpA